MLQTYTKKIVITGMVTLLFILSACGTSGVAGNSPTPAQTLQNSATAMSKLNSVHADLQSTVNIQSNGAASSTNGITFTVTGQADAASPNQVALNLSLGQSPLFAIVSTGQDLYLQKGTGQWYSVDSSKLGDGSQKYLSQGFPASLGQILALMQNAKLTDKGLETVNGQKLDHITATLDPQTLQALTTQLNGLFPAGQQSAQNQLKQGTMDLWIDPATSYVHQVKLVANAQMDLSSLSSLTGQQTGGSLVEPVVLNAQLNFSKFNQPVSIQAPSSSIPYPQQ